MAHASGMDGTKERTNGTEEDGFVVRPNLVPRPSKPRPSSLVPRPMSLREVPVAAAFRADSRQPTADSGQPIASSQGTTLDLYIALVRTPPRPASSIIETTDDREPTVPGTREGFGLGPFPPPATKRRDDDFFLDTSSTISYDDLYIISIQ